MSLTSYCQQEIRVFIVVHASPTYVALSILDIPLSLLVIFVCTLSLSSNQLLNYPAVSEHCSVNESCGSMTMKTCALFLNHGSPMMALEDTAYTKRLKQLGEELRPQLKGVVVFSAHHYERGISIGSGNREYPMIYDFYGFPDELYKVKYPARASTEIADKVKALFNAAGIKSTLDTKRGLDHGTWTMLKHLFPRGDVPVTDVSVVPALPPKEQIRIGQALRGLNKENILVIGSGATVHNFDEDYSETAWAQAFDDWLVARTVGREPDLEQLARYAELAPNVRRAFRTNEHFVPLLIAAGAAPPGAVGALIDRTPMEAFGAFIPAFSVRFDEP